MQSNPCSFTNFDVPNSGFTAVLGINDSGVLTGSFDDQNGNIHSFIFRIPAYSRDRLQLRSNAFTIIDFPGGFGTETGQINNRSWIVGEYFDGKTGAQKGFLLRNGKFTTIFIPGSVNTVANGINNQGVIVGTFDASTGEHGFARIGHKFVTFDFPGSSRTDARSINDAGEITGIYGDQNGGNHGFLFKDGHFTSIDFPGTSGVTSALGINSAGIVVGNYFPSTGHGFLEKEGHFETADFPGGSQSTIPFAINASKTMVGSYVNSIGQNHGFIAHCRAPRR